MKANQILDFVQWARGRVKFKNELFKGIFIDIFTICSTSAIGNSK